MKETLSMDSTARGEVPPAVLAAFGLQGAGWSFTAYGNGLINRTWKLENDQQAFILQRINQQVFRQPDDIAHNIQELAEYLAGREPDYLLVAPLPATDGQTLVTIRGDGYYRLFPFVNGSHTLQVVATPAQAFEAARQFGRFTRLLQHFDVSRLRITIPAFHDLTLRYEQFIHSVETGSRQRLDETQRLVQRLIGYSPVVSRFEEIRRNADFRQRVIHHDTKISNVLFDGSGRGLCVIDLDTVMPGYFISDVGDMMRTYLSPVSEEEPDPDCVLVRPDFYRAIREGYLGEMQSVLSQTEQDHFFYAGQFMIYMQALRFLTDYLQGDAYYGASYPAQNLNRARNQLRLLDLYSSQEQAWR